MGVVVRTTDGEHVARVEVLEVDVLVELGELGQREPEAPRDAVPRVAADDRVRHVDQVRAYRRRRDERDEQEEREEDPTHGPEPTDPGRSAQKNGECPELTPPRSPGWAR